MLSLPGTVSNILNALWAIPIIPLDPKEFLPTRSIARSLQDCARLCFVLIPELDQLTKLLSFGIRQVVDLSRV